MKVLVTGATGIVGGNLVRALVGPTKDVRALVRSSSDSRSLARLPIKLCEGDVLDPASLSSAMKGRNLVFHAAANFSYWGIRPEEQLDLAVRGTRNILEAASRADVRRVVVTSSSVVLGSASTRHIMDEAMVAEELEPSSYTLSKIRQEQVAFALGKKLNLSVVAVCPTLVMGAFDYRLSPSNANIVNYLNDPFRSTFTGGCNIVSAFDVAAGHVLAAERGRAGCRYVLGSENLTWYEIHSLISKLAGTFGPNLMLNNTATYLAATAAEMSARLSGTRPSVTRDEARMSGRFYWYSHNQIAKLGYAPMSARRALAEAIAWLITRSHVTDSVVGKLKLAPEVRVALARFAHKVPA